MRVPDRLLSAQRYAFLLLKFRPRSEQEMRERLGRKNFPPDIIERTIEFLSGKNFLNDRHFAREWIVSRLRKPVGLRKIARELRGKGVDGRIIEESLSLVLKDYAEYDVVERSARERIPRFKGIDRIKARNRLYGYLVRRGFTPSVVLEVVTRLMGEVRSE